MMGKSYVDYSGFVNTLNAIEKDVLVFIPQFLISSSELIEANTLPLTPLQDGFLMQSFTTHFMGDNSIRMEMSGLDNPKARGYDYAMIQHENEGFNHPIQGQANYLRDGVLNSQEDILKILEEGLTLIFITHR